jgi:hypothetical protein
MSREGAQVRGVVGLSCDGLTWSWGQEEKVACTAKTRPRSVA